MHIITQKRIREAEERHKSSAHALRAWLRLMEKSKFKNFSDLRRTFNSVDKAEHFYVFNIGENKLRIIADIHFNRHKVYIRCVLTHTEYDKNEWKVGAKVK